MTDNGGHFNNEEREILETDLSGELREKKSLVSKLVTIKKNKILLAERLNNENPGARKIMGKIQVPDRTSRFEITNENNITNFSVSIKDLDEREIIKNIQCNIVETIDTTIFSILHDSEEKGPHMTNVVIQNEGQTAVVISDEETDITTKQLTTGLQRLNLFLESVIEDPDLLSDFSVKG